MTDREKQIATQRLADRGKFNEWIEQCPVTITKVDNFAYGYVVINFIVDDERDADD